MSEVIYSYEHRTVELSDEEIVALAHHELPKLVESLDIRNHRFRTSYFIGLQHLPGVSKALYVAPKYDASLPPTNYLQMLSTCLQSPEILGHTDKLFDIEFNKPTIAIEQSNDLITPLIVVQFLRSVKRIVQKGLQKGYHTVTENKRALVKGKINVGRTIRQNHFRQRELYTWCTYQEFGFDHIANRLIKRALKFVQYYHQNGNGGSLKLDHILFYVNPAFENVSVDFDMKEVHAIKNNPFFTDYHDATRLAKLLLKRFGYNLSSIKKQSTIEIQPFWIDMSKLFELYVLGKLQEAIGEKDLVFQAKGNYGELDFLRTTIGQEIIIDAKYKPIYTEEGYDIDNIRQLSAYARDRGLLKKLNIPRNKWQQMLLNCLIIHPDHQASTNIDISCLLSVPIKQFEKFFKLGIALPTMAT